MATKKYNRAEFSATVNGKTYRFKGYTTDTRDGYCETVVSLDYPITDTKQSWCNRSWQRFDYESALSRAIEKFPKEMRESLHAQLIERKSAEEAEAAAKQLADFKRLYNGLSPENKERMKSYPMLQSEDDVRTCMGFMGLLTLMQS